MKSIYFVLSLIIFLAACGEYTPKPHAYPRIEFPEKEYAKWESDCPFSFEIPTYAIMEKDTDNNTEPCWYNMQFPNFDATLHLSYKSVEGKEEIDRLTEDAYKLAMKHTIKAEEIAETEIVDTLNGNYGVLYDFYGKTATPFNFYLTDQNKHYLRGAFYFNQNTNNDSVAPIFDFIKEDLLKGINSLRWKD